MCYDPYTRQTKVLEMCPYNISCWTSRMCVLETFNRERLLKYEHLNQGVVPMVSAILCSLYKPVQEVKLNCNKISTNISTCMPLLMIIAETRNLMHVFGFVWFLRLQLRSCLLLHQELLAALTVVKTAVTYSQRFASLHTIWNHWMRNSGTNYPILMDPSWKQLKWWAAYFPLDLYSTTWPFQPPVNNTVYLTLANAIMLLAVYLMCQAPMYSKWKFAMQSLILVRVCAWVDLVHLTLTSSSWLVRSPITVSD